MPPPLPATLLLPLLSLLVSPTEPTPVSLTVSPTLLSEPNATVTIRWFGVPRPSPLDWLGIYSPPDSEDDHFLGYIFLNSSPHWTSGAGDAELRLVNLRANYSFLLFGWADDEIDYSRLDYDRNPLPSTRRRLAVAADEIGFGARAGAAAQIHLAFTDEEDEVRVLFVTGDAAVSFVRFGVEEGRLDRVVATAVARYERDDMCDEPARSMLGWRDPGFVHDGVMQGLENGRRYFYQVGSDTGGWSEVHSFVSRDRNSRETFAFLFGDLGTYPQYKTFLHMPEESIATVKWILRDIEALGGKPAFVSHIGDISYARGFSWIWDQFFNQIEPIASKVPYHVCIGNHEYNWPSQPWRPEWSTGLYESDGGGECGVPYSIKFKMPGNSSLPTGTGSPDTRNLYYSFDAGVVHFLYMSTETNFLQGSDQYNFIKADLERVDRRKTPFVVVQGHRPMYTTSDDSRDVPLRQRMLEHLEPLLIQNNVTLVLWAHIHGYERFCALKNFSCINQGSNFTSGTPVHMVIGMGGQDWQPNWEPRPNHPDLMIFPQPERSMYRGGQYGYTRLVATREKLTLSYIGNHDGQVHDKLEILSGETLSISSNEKSVVESTFPWFIKAAMVLMVGVGLGYALGFITCYNPSSTERGEWVAVEMREI